jgi:predicted membrane protein
MCIVGIVKIGQGIQKLIAKQALLFISFLKHFTLTSICTYTCIYIYIYIYIYTHTQTHTQNGDLISLLFTLGKGVG